MREIQLNKIEMRHIKATETSISNYMTSCRHRPFWKKITGNSECAEAEAVLIRSAIGYLIMDQETDSFIEEMNKK
jgi:hypothetical protein